MARAVVDQPTLDAEPDPSPGIYRGIVLDGRYRLERQLGRGGMGQVWMARHLTLDRRVAIKFVDAFTPSTQERLLREAQVLAALEHPAIVRVFDCGDGGALGPYVAMELFEGESLEDRLGLGPLPAAEAVRLFLPLLRGLAFAHKQGVVHRDLKPANILLRGAEAKLIDFGIAYLARTERARMTQGGGVLGTPAYMAPEQARGDVVDGRADIWAAAVTLYEAITGRPVFDGPEPVAIMTAVLRQPIVRPADPRLDDALWAILARALQRPLHLRTPTMDELVTELEAWLRGARSGVKAAAPRGPAAVGEHPDEADIGSMDALIRQRFGDT